MCDDDAQHVWMVLYALEPQEDRKLAVTLKPARFSDLASLRRDLDLASTTEALGTSLRVGFYATPTKIKLRTKIDLSTRMNANGIGFEFAP